jgi:hypothetical protein
MSSAVIDAHLAFTAADSFACVSADRGAFGLPLAAALILARVSALKTLPRIFSLVDSGIVQPSARRFAHMASIRAFVSARFSSVHDAFSPALTFAMYSGSCHISLLDSFHGVTSAYLRPFAAAAIFAATSGFFDGAVSPPRLTL